MAEVYPCVIDGFSLYCTDSVLPAIDLSFIDPTTEMTIQYDNKTKASGSPLITQIVINCVQNAAQLHTSVITGNNVCTSITGTIKGSSKKVLAGQQSLCLADDTINGLTIAAYAGNGTLADLTATWSNSSSGASGTVSLKAWFKAAGQDKVCAY